MSRLLSGNGDLFGVFNFEFFSAPSTRDISRCLDTSPRLPFMHSRVWDRCVVTEGTLIDRCCYCCCLLFAVCCCFCFCSSQLGNVSPLCVYMRGAAANLFSGTAPALAATANIY